MPLTEPLLASGSSVLRKVAQPRSGRPRTATDEEHQQWMQELLDESRSWTTVELSRHFDRTCPLDDARSLSNERSLCEVGAKGVDARTEDGA